MSVLPKSPWLLDTILDGSPLRHGIPASWHSLCRPQKDDRQNKPHLVLIQQPNGILTQDSRIPSPPPQPLSQHQAWLWFSWVKTNIQAFIDSLDAAILSVPVCGEDVEVMERFIYLGGDIHVSACCEPEVNGCLGWAWRVVDSLNFGVWHCWYLCRRMKVWVYNSFLLPVLLFGCETWTLTKDLWRRLNSLGTGSLRRIIGCRWSDFMSKERLLRETQMRFVTWKVCEH